MLCKPVGRASAEQELGILVDVIAKSLLKASG